MLSNSCSSDEKTPLGYAQNAPHFLGSFVCNVQGEKAHLFLEDGNLLAKIHKHNGEVIQLSNHQIKGGKKGEMPSEELIDLIKRVAAPLLFASLKKNNTLCIFLNNFHEINQFNRPRVLLPPNFYSCVEREGLLTELLLLLQEKQVVILVKDPGLPLKRVGKTELATQYFKGYAENYTHTFWIQAISPYHLERNLKKMARTLQISFDQIAEWLKNNNSYLVVFDGIEDVTLIENYLQDAQGHILVTSRIPIPSHDCLEVGLFTKEEGTTFLLTHVEGTQEAAEQVTQALGYVPSSMYRALETIQTEGIKLSLYTTYCQSLLEKNALETKGKSNLPARNKDFVGREVGLVALEESFSANKPVVLAANAGMGGVGKTQIALQYAYRTCLNYNLIWWIKCGSMESSYEELAKRLKVNITEEEKREENALIKKVNRHLERIPGWLLIFDDAESQKNLDGLLPKSGGHILITSRNPNWEKTQAEVFGIEVFKREESIDLILKVTGLYEQKQEADQLAEVLQDLPLALAQAAAYIRETDISIEEYISDFKKVYKALLKREKPTDNYEYTVNVTWNISMEKIQAEEKQEGLAPYPIALPLMQICSFFAPNGIPKETLLLQWIEMEHEANNLDASSCLSDLNRSLSLLARYSMINITEQTISMHTLVQMVTRGQLNPSEKQIIFTRGSEILSKCRSKYDPREPKNSQFSISMLPHYETFVEQYENFEESKLNEVFLFILDYLYLAHRYFGRYTKELKYAQDSLKAAKAMYSDDMNQAVTASLNNVGVTLQKQGKYEEALGYQLEALRLRREYLGDKHIEVAISLNNVGFTLGEQGNHDESLKYLMEALELWRELVGEDHPNVAVALNNIGLSLGAQDKNEEALKYYKDALAIRKIKLGDQHPDVAESLNNVGHCLTGQKKVNEALPFLQEALKIWKSNFGQKHPLVATALSNIGRALSFQKKLKESLEFYMEALELLKELTGEDHPNVAKILDTVSEIFREQGDYQSSLKHQKQAFEIWKNLLGNDKRLAAAKSLRSIGTTLIAQNSFDSAYECFREAIEIWESSLAQKHLFVAESLEFIGVVLTAQQKGDESLEYFLRALHMKKELLDDKNLIITDSLVLVGNCLFNQKKFLEALPYLIELLELRKMNYGENHLDIITCYNDMGLAYRHLLDYKNARECYQKAIGIQKILLGESHPNLVNGYNAMAFACNQLGDYNEELECYQNVLMIGLNDSTQHPVHLALMFSNVADVCETLNNYQEALENYQSSLNILLGFVDANNPNFIKIYKKIGSLYHNLQNYSQALNFYQKTIRICQWAYPKDHPELIELQNVIDEVNKHLT